MSPAVIGSSSSHPLLKVLLAVGLVGQSPEFDYFNRHFTTAFQDVLRLLRPFMRISQTAVAQLLGLHLYLS